MNTSEIIFRPIRVEDNAAVADIILSVMEGYGCMGEGFSSSDPEVHDMYHYYLDDRSAFYVIEYRGQVLGCGGIAPLQGADPTICELKKMYFLAELRGHGYGQKMIDQCLTKAKELGYQQCYLETVEAMQAANHLYRKNGFIALTSHMGATGHSGCDAYYIKAL